MLNHSWPLVTAVIWLLTCCFNSAINGQSQNAIGAHRAFQKTSFSCSGRPAGYYADIETGCQVYHMCDGLGRQFSYSCPNTTLFQQRMLICDHWYMVNCSKAESDYAANLLIGQRDKPFVNDEENSLRTPRPDLLDRPYAPDYSGESFRNQYKQIPAVQNQILDTDAQKNADKTATVNQILPSQQRWKIPPPSRTIEPPAFETHHHRTAASGNRVQNGNQQTTLSSRGSTKYPSGTTSTTSRPASPAPPPQINRKQSIFNNAALLQRQQNTLLGEQDDLGTSHSTRYNTSADFNSAEINNNKIPNGLSNRKSFSGTSSSATTTTKFPIKVPSKIYEPPFVYPIYNQDGILSTETPLAVSTAAPFKAPVSTRVIATTTPTTRAPSRPTTVAGKPFTAAPTTVAAVTSIDRTQNNALPSNYEEEMQRFESQKTFQDSARTPTPAQGFKSPTTQAPISAVRTLKPPIIGQRVDSSPFDYNVPTTDRLKLPTPFIGGSNSIQQPPPIDLLPPFPNFVQRDTATTQGPPIYYQWKVPSNGLEPPKLDAPYGVDGRKYPETVVDYNSIATTAPFTGTTSFGIDQQTTDVSSKTTNPVFTVQTTINDDTATTRVPTSRSIKDTSDPNTLTPPTTASKTTIDTRRPSASTAFTDYSQLRKDFSVPDYAFPLESIGRTGYFADDTYNSFQLKIPERRSDAKEPLHWFGENPKCPECHPSYVIPGTCEPCLRR